jgi:hypothetical protein
MGKEAQINLVLKENELSFLNSYCYTFHGEAPDKISLLLDCKKPWEKLFKEITIENSKKEKIVYSFLEPQFWITIPKSFLTKPGIVINCIGQNYAETPTFCMSSNFLVIGVDSQCEI